MRVIVTVESGKARQRMASLRSRATTLIAPLRDIADDFLSNEREIFDLGSAHWAPLDPDWAARKLRLGFGARTLVLTDTLRESLTNSNARYSVREISSNELLVGTRDPVAHLHQDGTGRMPARPPVVTTPLTERRWARVLHDWLIGGV